MAFTRRLFVACVEILLCGLALNAQQTKSIPPRTNPAESSVVVPRLVNFSGKAIDLHGKAISQVTGATFAVYRDQYEGAALWIETQNIHPESDGNYTVQLGATKSEGLPVELFSTTEPRWLDVHINGGEEQPRVLLVSVPYALKAADAETLGGKPLSAFQLSIPGPSGSANSQAFQANVGDAANEIACSSTTACKTGFVPEFTTNGGSAKVSNSLISQSGTTVTISGSDNITGSETVTGSITAGTVTGSLGVLGQTALSGNDAAGVSGVNTGNGIGVFGTGGTGVFGTGSTTAGDFVTSAGTAVVAEADSPSSFALDAFGNGAGVTAVIQNLDTSAVQPILSVVAGTNVASCTIDIKGNLACTGSKSAVVPVDNGSRKVALYAIEGPENWFEDAGSAQLSHGEAVVNLESVFGQTVNTDLNYHVFLTPKGDCKGLYVSQETSTSFVVRELGGGTSNIAFDYRIMAKRKGYEKIRLEDKTAVLEQTMNHIKRIRENRLRPAAKAH